MKLLSALLSVAMLVGVNQAFAQKKKALVDQMGGQGYGMAGCGAGSLVFADKPGIVQIFAATTNGTSINQSFGISTGTLNCGDGSKIVQSEQFIETNKMALENEMARGQGETLTSLSQVLECKNNNFSTEMTKNYQQSFPQGGASSEQMSAVAYKSCQI
jgi:hypothetical protein